jgi:hypothetical protein
MRCFYLLVLAASSVFAQDQLLPGIQRFESFQHRVIALAACPRDPRSTSAGPSAKERASANPSHSRIRYFKKEMENVKYVVKDGIAYDPADLIDSVRGSVVVH